MGRVYRAEQSVLGRTVAVKIIHPHLLSDENSALRFMTEARAASQLNHPNSIAVFDFGRTVDGQPYLVMEFLRGKDLARVAYEEGPLPFARIVDILRQVLAALAEAHDLSIVHRDLKPENIVVEPLRRGGDFVKVGDKTAWEIFFGSSKRYSSHSAIPRRGHQVMRGMPWSFEFLGISPSHAARTVSPSKQCEADTSTSALGGSGHGWASGPWPITGKAEIRSRAQPMGMSVTVSTGSDDSIGLSTSGPTRPR